jgi:hypothetical protein
MRRRRDASIEENLAAFERFAAQTKIRVPGEGRVPFLLRPEQREAARQWLEHRYALDLKARQVGWTTLVSVFVLWSAMSLDDWFCALLSRGEREAKKLLAKSKLAHKSLPSWVKDRASALVDNNVEKMTFANGSEIESLPAGNEPGRGDSLDLMVLDEWAFLPDPDSAWAATEPVTDIGGSVIAISTANGSGNLFHKTWLASQVNMSDFHGLFFPWWVVPHRDQAWYERKRGNAEEVGLLHKFYQEYPSSPDEAFLKSGANVFDVDRLMAMTVSEPLARYSHDGKAFIPDPHGELRVWEHAQYDVKGRDMAYVMGADVARGLGHGDASVAWVLRADTQEAVAVWHGRVDVDLFGEKILRSLGRMFHNALIAPENNGPGLATIKALQRTGYQRIYRSRSIKHRSEQKVETLGYSTSATSKPLIIAELNAWLRVNNVPDRFTIEELKSYVRNDEGRMEGSPFDDRVIALAIAVQMLKYAYAREYAPDAPVVANTFAWYLNETRKADRTTKKLMILGGRVS